MTTLRTWQAMRMRRWLRGSVHLGDAPQLIGKPTVYAGEGQLRIGDRFTLSSRPVASHLVAGNGGTLSIGDDVAIGCGAAIAAYERVEIGSGTRIGPFVIIMDTNFHSAGDQSVRHDCLPVVIGERCVIGCRVTIVRGATIGDGAEILAGSVVSSAIPAGACAAGGRARIIGRAGELASRWDSPAAELPELLMKTLGLRSAPDLDDTPIPGQLWSDEHVASVVKAVRDGMGMEMDRASVHGARTYADVAAALQHALPAPAA
jgi:acetyltransferase-like isoleucine patch superfamily enzyme